MKQVARLLLLGLLAACGDAQIQVPEALTILSVSPHHGATQVDLSPDIIISFNAAIDPASLSDASLHLDGSDTTVPTRRVLSADKKSVRLVPSNVLLAGVSYQIVVEDSVAGALFGPLASTQRSRFRTRSR